MTFDEFWASFDQHGSKGAELFKGHNYNIGKAVWNAALNSAMAAVSCAQYSDDDSGSGANGNAYDAVERLLAN